MSWTTPKTWAYKETFSSSDANTHIRDNLNALRDGTGIANDAITTPKISNPYKFRAYRSASYVFTKNSWTKVSLNTESYDTNSDFDKDTNYRYTAPVTGFYQVNACIAFTGNVTIIAISIWKDGSEISRGAQFNLSSTEMHIPFSDVIQLTAGEYIELYAYGNTSSGDLTLYQSGSGSTYMSAHLLSE